ncbi:hypothetical protein T265_07530 [Opisthorchis viverrini]|uniref:Mitochondrial inner membrane protein Mpv17 n=2 Tax=Opisthorchis viverrini TaxID=6198 RepID=A0A074ZC68_OPIVI|nr:hypothetical protein T265_07530 [Opisthorchis viverrini]KER24906.1 hypothetical protein T265_07530 [Opisthorchis viverrini]
MRAWANNSPFQWITRLPLLTRGRKYNPLLKDAIVAGAMMVVGEILAEEIRHHMSKPHHGTILVQETALMPVMRTPEQKNESWLKGFLSRTEIDARKVCSLGLYGAFQGCLMHFFYCFIDKKLPGASLMTVSKKLILDELTMAPTCLIGFFLYNGVRDTGTLDGGLQRVKHLFWPAYIADMMLWPLLQAINFGFLPTRYRVTYIAVFTCLWNTYLCYLNFQHPLHTISKTTVDGSDL